MQRLFIIILVFFTILSCNRNGDSKKIMSRDDFVDILVDIHIFDAYSTEHSLSDYISDIDSLSLYESIFHKYNTNVNSFQATMDYYSSQPEALGKIYDEVFGKISRINHDISDQISQFASSDLKLLSDINKYYLVRGDTAKYPEPFIISVPGPGKIMATAQVRLLSDDKSVNPYIYAYFFKDEADNNPEDRLEFINFPMKKSNFSRDYQFMYNLEDKEYKFISIQIPKVANQDSVFKKNMQISNLRVQYIPKEKPANKEVPDSLNSKK